MTAPSRYEPATIFVFYGPDPGAHDGKYLVLLKRILSNGGVALMIRNKPLRRSLGALLVLLGALMIWLPYDLASGIVLVLAGAVLELVGIRLEKSDKQR